MSNLRFFTTVESKARDHSIIPVEEGRFLILTDMRKLTYDFGGQRLELGDVVELETEAQRQKLLTPLNKFYYIKETNALWRYDGEWVRYADEKMVQEHIGKSIVSAEGVHGLRFNQEANSLEVYDGTQSKFVPVLSEDHGKTILCTLLSDRWQDGRQVVSVPGLSGEHNGIVGLAQNVTPDVVQAVVDSGIYLAGQNDGTLEFVSDGETPKIDIPLNVVLIEMNKATSCTLYARNWKDGKQTVSVPGLDHVSGGTMGLDQAATRAERNAAAAAGLFISGQRDNEMDISSSFAPPSIDVPIIVLHFN